MSFSDDRRLEHIGTSLFISCVRNTLRVLARAKSVRRHRFELDRYICDTVSVLAPLTRMFGVAVAVAVGPLAGLTLPDDDVDAADDK